MIVSMDSMKPNPECSVKLRYRSCTQPQHECGNLTDAFGFALDWPTRQVVCAPASGSWEEDVSPTALPPVQDSDKVASEIRESGGGLQTLGQCEQNHTATQLIEVGQLSATQLHPNDSAINIYSCGFNSPVNDSSLTKPRGNKLVRKIEQPTALPLEIMAMIISHATVAEPRCALNLVVPDWKICPRENSEPQASSKITRVVTYARGVGVQVGVLSYKYEHRGDDHILTPMIDFDPNIVALNVSFCSEYTRNFYRNHTHVFTLGTSNLPGGAVEEIIRNDWREAQPLRNSRLKAILPFDDEKIEDAKTRASLTLDPIYRYLRHIAVHSPLELMRVEEKKLGTAEHASSQAGPNTLHDALDLDRSAHLWLSWSRMVSLESVFLDLRFYSHDINTQKKCLSKLQVIERAREMGRHLQLKTLVLAGLQSYSFRVSYEGITARDIEQWDEIDGEPNWIGIFRPAIRGGGKIILVDKLVDRWPPQ